MFDCFLRFIVLALQHVGLNAEQREKSVRPSRPSSDHPGTGTNRTTTKRGAQHFPTPHNDNDNTSASLEGLYAR